MSKLYNLQDTTPAADAGFQLAQWKKALTPSGTDATSGNPYYDASTEVPNTGGVSVKTGSYILQASDCGLLIVVNSSSASILTLPSTVPFAQWQVRIANIGSGTVSVIPGGSLSLDGSTSTSISVTQFKSVTILTDGTNYFSARGLGGSGSGSGMNYLGAWAAGAYSVGNVVLYNGNLYLCISPVTAGTPAFVQSAQGTANSNLSVAFTSSVTVGDLLLVSIATTGSWTAPTDTLGTTYTLAAQQTGTNNTALYYGVAPSSGPNTVSTFGGSPDLAMVISEFSHVNALPNATAAQYLASGGVGSHITIAITSTIASSLVYAAIGGNTGHSAFTTITGFSIAAQTSNGSGSRMLVCPYSFETTAGAYSPGAQQNDGTSSPADFPAIAVAFDSGIQSPSIDTAHWEPFPGTLANLLTATGDLIVGGTVVGGFATPTRLAAGTSGNVLTSNGPGAAPSWQPASGGGGGGALTKIAQVVVSGSSTTSITFSSIPGTYTTLKLIGYGVSSAVADDGVGVQFNGDTGANYDYSAYFNNGSSIGAFVSSAGTSGGMIFGGTSGSRAAQVSLEIASYASTSFYKTYHGVGTIWSISNGSMKESTINGDWKNTAAITSIKLFLSSSGHFVAGTVFTLYGVS